VTAIHPKQLIYLLPLLERGTRGDRRACKSEGINSMVHVRARGGRGEKGNINVILFDSGSAFLLFVLPSSPSRAHKLSLYHPVSCYHSLKLLIRTCTQSSSPRVTKSEPKSEPLHASYHAAIPLLYLSASLFTIHSLVFSHG
jgi:hypothetical protein